MRYLLLTALLERGLNKEAGVSLAEHEDDLQALWPYGRLLWRLRADGGSPDTRAAFDAAIQANPYVVSYLLDPDSIPFRSTAALRVASREEAAYVAETLADAFARPMALLIGCGTDVAFSVPNRPRTGEADKFAITWLT